MEQITIRKSMRNSVQRFGNNVQFTMLNGSTLYIKDESLDPDSQVVTLQKVSSLGEVIGTIQFAAADFELLVELSSLENRNIRKVEDIDDLPKIAK